MLATPLGARVRDNLSGIGKALKDTLAPEDFADAEHVKTSGRELFEPRYGKGGSHEIWKIRPLPQILIDYCSNDVLYLFIMLERFGDGSSVFKLSSTARRAISELRTYFQVAAYELIRSSKVDFHWIFQDTGKRLAADGNSYSMEDFIKFFGGVDQWNAADIPMEVLANKIEDFCDASPRVCDALRKHLSLYGQERTAPIAVAEHLPIHMRQVRKAFLPGPLGFEMGGADGSIVTKLEEGFESEKLGVRVGYRVAEVNNVPYGPARFSTLMRGTLPFEITFHVREVICRRAKSKATPEALVEPPSPTKLTRSVSLSSNAHRICWHLGPGILETKVRVATSKEFDVESTTFQLLLWPEHRKDGKTAYFNTCDNRGFVELKCTGDAAGLIRFRLFVGNQLPRGPTTQNFCMGESAGLTGENSTWDLQSGIINDSEHGPYLLIGAEIWPVPLQ